MSDQEKQVMIVKVRPVLKKDGTLFTLDAFGLVGVGFFKVVETSGCPFLINPWNKMKRHIGRRNYLTGNTLEELRRNGVQVEIV